MIKIMAAVLACLLLSITSVKAKSRYGYNPFYDRHAFAGPYFGFTYGKAKYTKKYRLSSQSQKKVRSKTISQKNAIRTSLAPVIQPHPVGCPRTRFCGCGASIMVHGKNIRSLWLARNWFKYPKSEVKPMAVAVRRGHVFVILKDLGNNKVLAYDPNSGGHKTRIHVRSLRGFSVRDPLAKFKLAAA